MSGARVPFALIGVLLLVGSATFAGSLGGPTVSEPDVERAMDRTESATQSAVRDAVTTAATDAAREPVTLGAASPTGRVLDSGNEFRDALRVRIYVAVRDRLERVSHEQGDVTVTASLPPTPTAEDLDRAIGNVSVSRAGEDGTELRATVENVTLTARRGGEVVGQRTVSPTVQVPVPTLAVHDSVEEFERRLNGGPAEQGLGGRLTAQLYALTWTRGYAQYGGASISNVVANRHLSLLTNANVLSMQREHFGTSDQRGREVLRWATAHTAMTDMVDGSDAQVASYLSQLNNYEAIRQLPATILERGGATTPATAPDDTVTVGVNDTADRAFLETIDDLEAVIEETYTTEVQLRQEVVDSRETVVEEPREPEPDWELLARQKQTDVSTSVRSARPPELDGPWHLLEYHPRTVTREVTITRLWNTSDGVVRTTEVRAEHGDVDVILAGRHDGGPAPQRPVRTVHERGGPLDGPNLEGVKQKARQRLVGHRTIDGRAAEGLAEDGTTTTATVTGEMPDGIYEYVYEDVAQLRDRVRDVSFTTTRGKLATYQVNSGRRLRQRITDRWESLVGAPTSYVAVPTRAKRNARIAYLQAVASRLERRAAAHDDTREEVNEGLAEEDMRSLESMQEDYERRGSDPDAGPLPVSMRVEAAPSYLTLGTLDGQRVQSLPADEQTTPLVARNVNAFTSPHSEIASGLVESFVGPERVQLRAAVQTLRTARETDGQVDGESVDTAALESDIEDALGTLTWQAQMQLVGLHGQKVSEEGLVVQSALAEYEGTLPRADAWLNGSAIEAIQAEAERRYDLTDAQSDELWVRLKAGTALALASDGAKPPAPTVNETSRQLQAAVRDVAVDQTEQLLETGSQVAMERVLDESLDRLPAGLPIAPPVFAWVTTVNYWQVEIAGEYTRFVVSVPRGTPDTPGARFRYVRTDDTVTLDVDEDGSAETLGRTGRVRFRTHTSVAIAVPPGMRGVGDVDGVRDERSSGWPDPG